MQKWNPKINQYEPYTVPVNWHCPLIADMDTIINCARCGKQMPFGKGYASHQIHNNYGMGYSVCVKCYDKEWKEENDV